ncbi:metallophosphoesterase family protein [Halosimplex halobium]|uniref:metallophosphoesterase family protein n=1 Tax=Halosimplex halobium TaxID=3396618 RepID=UPI003F573A9F
MNLGLISDIHGNRPALEAVLADGADDVDEFVCLGDIVGYGPWPSECVHLIQQHCETVIRGNHDREALDPEGYTDNEMAMAGLRYAEAELITANLEWLQSRPRKTDLLDGDALLVHDHPEQVDRYVMPRGFPEVRPYLDDYEACFLGHTHLQHEAVIDDRLILNPGSVGQPRDGDSRAAYAVVDTDTWETDLRRVEYDIETVQRKVAEEGLPPEIGERLAGGR